MINGVFDVTAAQYAAIKASLAGSSDTYVSEVDGRLITDPRSFYVTIGMALEAPRDDMEQITNADWFYDEITTLCWSDDPNGVRRHHQYVLGVFHPDSIDVGTRWSYRQMFEDAASFWAEEVVHPPSSAVSAAVSPCT